MITTNETLNTLLNDLRLNEAGEGLEKLALQNHRYLKDLRINLANALKSDILNKRVILLIALAVARNEGKTEWIKTLESWLIEVGSTEAELAEVVALVSLLNVNNVFYRFRHFMQKQYYSNTPAGIKMSIMLNPILGKGLFELLSLVVSALNGCQLCVESHEASLRENGYSEIQIYEAIKVAAVFKGLAVVLD